MLFRMKKYSEKLLLPLGRKISHVPANRISIFGFGAAALAFLGFWFQLLWLALISLFLIEFFDQLDGVIARLQGTTKFGGFLDSTLDRYGDALLFYGLILGGYVSFHLGILVMVGALITSYTRARIEAAGHKSVGGVGILERTDRIPLLFFGALLQFWLPTALWITMLILAIGTHLTAAHRFRYASKVLSHDPEDETPKEEPNTPQQKL